MILKMPAHTTKTAIRGIIVFIVSLCFSGFLFANNNPQVEIKPPPSYVAKKIFLFPLNVPHYAIRAATWPIGILLRFAEETHLLEKTLDFLSNKEKTFWVYPIIEGGAGSGFGGGLGVEHIDLFNRGYKINATYRIHINLDNHATFSFGKPDAFTFLKRDVSWAILADWNRIQEDDYYGLGPNTSQSNHAAYRYDDITVDLILSLRPFENVVITPSLGLTINSSGNNRNGDLPNIQDLFPANQTQGYQRTIGYFVPGLRLAHDTRNNLDTPSRGGIRAASFKRFQGYNTSAYDYNFYELDVRQYIGLWAPKHVLVLHTGWGFAQALGSNSVPFAQLSTLDNSSPDRGFSRNRFKDNDVAVFNIEYRFPLWSLLDGVAFYDTGLVFPGLTSFDIHDLKNSGGGGIHFAIPNLMRFRFEAAYGGEGINVMFGASKPL